MDGERSIWQPVSISKQYARLLARMMEFGAEPITVSGRREIVGMGHNGRLFAYLHEGQLALKLPSRRSAFLFNAGMVQRFKYRRVERSFEWVLVHRGSEWIWDHLVDEVFQYA
ncbi:hypothetical protein [Hyphomicrobium sp.]|uniref:hypothetical protein n=1 Tax=Hyphomicrobium sp. TaxID=82 RepID=UPI001D417E95|nr:hypothetical protein [Hyphomicrobium sp.]MBY0560463.1 hypothetical protein [Hyphomicrobium sp.]